MPRRKKDRSQLPVPKLNGYELELIKSHMPSQKHLWMKVLFKVLDFYNSYIDSAHYLQNDLSIPYFTRKKIAHLIPRDLKSETRNLIKDPDKRVLLEILKSMLLDSPDLRHEVWELNRKIVNRGRKHGKEIPAS